MDDPAIELLSSQKSIRALHLPGQDRQGVKWLQQLLYELGFGRELQWEQERGTGEYGAAVKRAVRLFAKLNGIDSDGAKLTQKLATQMLKLRVLLEELQAVRVLIDTHRVEQTLFIGSPHKAAVAAWQTLLHTLGHGDELDWGRHLNDGVYGPKTAEATRAFAQSVGMQTRGEVLGRQVAALAVRPFSARLGREWLTGARYLKIPVHVAGLVPPAHLLVRYESAVFLGKPLVVARGFVPFLEKIGAHALGAGIKLFVHSSFRASPEAPGAIVLPQHISNHLIGHAVDAAVFFGGKLFGQAHLGEPENLPAQVRQFLQACHDVLRRCKGVALPQSPLHFDDGYHQNLTAWQEEHRSLQKHWEMLAIF